MVATPLQACLTQIKKKKLKKIRMKSKDVARSGSDGPRGREIRGVYSIKAFASPSKATWFHPFLEASYIT